MTYMDDILSAVHEAEKDGGVIRKLKVRSTSSEELDATLAPPLPIRTKKELRPLADDDETT